MIRICIQISPSSPPHYCRCSAAAKVCTDCPGQEVYEPVCIDGITYTSPCIAACTDYNSTSSVSFPGLVYMWGGIFWNFARLICLQFCYISIAASLVYS